MRAVAIEDFGSEPTVQDLPYPEPAEGEVLVRVAAASVNGFDLAVVGGKVKGRMAYVLPIVIGRDFAGTVEASGSGVAGFAPGDEVFGVLMGPTLGAGTFAEAVALPAAFVAKRPADLPVESAGALGLAGTTAKQAVDTVAPTPGETVLIAGATGGVGSIAVQLAKAAGATVIATATPDRAAFVRDLGADEVVDHRGDLTAAVRALRPEGVDAVVHASGDALVLGNLVVPGGRLSSTIGAGPDLFGDRDLTVTPIGANPTTDVLDQLAASAVAGDIRVPIQQTYTLDEAAQALADFGSPKRGKLVIDIR